MQQISNFIQTKEFKSQTKITTKWQDRAYQIWESFNLSRKDLPNLFRFFKFNYDQNSGLIEQAYSFTFDYEGSVPKLKLFYWKFNQLKK